MAAQVDPLARARDRADSASTSAASSPTAVNTERLWSASAWTSSRSTPPKAAQRVERRRVAALREVRHGLERQLHAAYSKSPMKEYYDTRAPEYDDWYSGAAASPSATGPPGASCSASSPTRSAPSRRRARSTSPAAPATRQLAPRRGDRARPERADAGDRGGAAPRRRPSSRATRSRFRSERQLRPRRDDELLRPPGGRRPRAIPRRGAPRRARARRRRRRAPGGHRAGGAAGADPQRRLELDGLQALLHRGRARSRSSAAARPYDGRWFVVVARRGDARSSRSCASPTRAIGAAFYAHLGFDGRVGASVRGRLLLFVVAPTPRTARVFLVRARGRCTPGHAPLRRTSTTSTATTPSCRRERESASSPEDSPGACASSSSPTRTATGCGSARCSS